LAFAIAAGMLAGMVEVRELTPQDWQLKRELRLAALLDSPSAFLSTYADASQRDDAGWRDWPTAPASAFGAIANDEGVGLVGIDEAHAVPGLAYLFAMWVKPSHRGQGVADGLVDAAVGWTRQRGLAGVLLEVAPGNERATAFYARYGFRVSDDPISAPCDTPMRLMLDQNKNSAVLRP